jgi:uncharacterized protein (DUF885 family)
VIGHAPALSQLVDSYLDLRWHLDPVAATEAGVAEHDGRLGAFAGDDVKENIAALRAIEAAFEALEVDELEDEIDRTAVLNDVRCRIHVGLIERPHLHNPAYWVSHFLEGLYLLLIRRDRSRAHRGRAARARMEAAPAFFHSAEATLRECPSVFVDTAIGVVNGGVQLIEEIGRHWSEGDGVFADVTSEAVTTLESFGRFLETRSVAVEGGFAVGDLGFRRRLELQHASSDSPEDLSRYGTELVECVTRDIEATARAIDPSTPWPDLVDRLREDHPTADQLVGEYAEAMERARAFVIEHDIAAIPEGVLEVVPTPSYLRPIIPFAAYQPPGLFSSDRQGLFHVTVPPRDLDAAMTDRLLSDHCRHDLATTALHEGYPGHHLQFLSAQGLERPVRRLLPTPLIYEGWALYCESMMAEAGFFRTPEERLFQQLALLWRGVRVVLDVGLHTSDMTVPTAVDLLCSIVRMDRHAAEGEVRRYCAEPTYPMSYAVGRRELLALRRDYAGEHPSPGERRAFHDAVLARGGLPPNLMRWGMGL